MKLYEQYLIEKKVFTKNSNAPCAAYETVYGKKCPSTMTGKYFMPHGTKTWNGISIDGHIEDKWLNDLSNIKQIEMRSSCEGHNKERVTFIIFRFLDKSYDRKAKSIEKKLETDRVTKASSQIGREGQLRFIVAAKLWYGQPGWKEWWTTLAKRIRNSL